MIKNLTRKRKLEVNVKICTDIFSQSIGLMFSKKKNNALIFKFNAEKIIPLHMFFVFYPIDVLFLDKRKTVVELKKNFRPFTFYTPKKKAMYVLEMPAGTINKSKTKLGDILNF